MGYSEVCCQLCGVTFAIARHRRADEPPEAAWDYTGTGFISSDHEEELVDFCGEHSGCQLMQHEGSDELEHIAGPGCMSGAGYSGHQISLEEMKGCRAIQCLVRKRPDWTPEPDDQDWELNGNYFVTGIGDGSPDESQLEVDPPRHGTASVWANDVFWDHFEDEDSGGLPVHPTCFEIFKRLSRRRFGFVDVHSLYRWRILDGVKNRFNDGFPYGFAVTRCQQQWWDHMPGTEYLAANPINIPRLRQLLKNHSCLVSPWSKGVVFHFRYTPPGASQVEGHATPPPAPTGASTSDPFQKLPSEIQQMILAHCTTRDITNLRLASRAYRQLPIVLFRRLTLEDMPWLWEVEDVDAREVNWFDFYRQAKTCWMNMKGLQNRRRIWRAIEEVLNRLDKYRRDGVITDDDDLI
ncbi:hypothetical protein AJ79_06600 [Helicocarpus griseus UAMH5409]|uniref:F-box domain-containing protein n=1 Tax=Helicocarpus griseus UAMH5409 TaxID=1447875 RepID=A0A2B7XBV4_9EURO|nr:hypothetical protein AJ79_06600 [Helicocarpus griseus UAMH5409]